MRLLACGVLCAVLAVAADGGFEVASIKPAKAGARGFSIRPLPGRVSAENVTLKLLIGEAYHVQDFQISGGPRWVDVDRYDVEAKVAGDTKPTPKELRAMLQKLLEDRFALKVRRDSKEMQAYLLSPAKSGIKLQPAKDPDQPTMFRVYQRHQITAGNAPLDHLTEALTWILGTPVLDRTGVEGTFDYSLDWAPDELQVRSGEAPVETDGAKRSLNSELQHKLGLTLVSKREPVDIIIIETASKPTGN